MRPIALTWFSSSAAITTGSGVYYANACTGIESRFVMPVRRDALRGVRCIMRYTRESVIIFAAIDCSY